MKFLLLSRLKAPKLGLLLLFLWFFPNYLAYAELVGPAWVQIKNKPTTVASYGITDVYTKEEIATITINLRPVRENLTLQVATSTITFTTEFIHDPNNFYLYVNGLLMTDYTVDASDTATLLVPVPEGSQVVGIRFD